jgi:hypothetical protein
MIITYLRSSSAGSFEWCKHKYFLTYCLGFKDNSNKKAVKGNIVHKALELLANKQLSLQTNSKVFIDDELEKSFDTLLICPEESIKSAFDFYSIKETDFEWTKKDYEECTKWMWDTLLFSDGMFSPLERRIVEPEKYFDIEVDKPWAKYDFRLMNGETVSGNLRLKGTMDLITRIDSKTIEYIDWKTGERKNWSTGKEKGYDDLFNDFQLRLYHYALSKVYPNEENIIITVFFVRSGGPFTICFHKEDLEKTEEMIRDKFESIKKCKIPARIIDLKKDKWKCERLCKFYKDDFENTGVSTCQKIHEEILELGLEKVYAKYADFSAVKQYGSGGGKTNRE